MGLLTQLCSDQTARRSVPAERTKEHLKARGRMKILERIACLKIPRLGVLNDRGPCASGT